MAKCLLVMLVLLVAPATGLAQTTLFGGIGRGGGPNQGEIVTIDQTTGAATLVGEGATDSNMLQDLPPPSHQDRRL